MNLKDAIQHARKVSEEKRADADYNWRHGRLNSDDCIKCAEEHEKLADWLEKLSEYETAERDGKLKIFPVALGSTVYELQKIRKRIQPYIITGASVALNNSGYFFSWKLKDGKGIYGNINGFSDSRIGKTVFLTKEEAEKALSDLKEQ